MVLVRAADLEVVAVEVTPENGDVVQVRADDVDVAVADPAEGAVVDPDVVGAGEGDAVARLHDAGVEVGDREVANDDVGLARDPEAVAHEAGTGA